MLICSIDDAGYYSRAHRLHASLALPVQLLNPAAQRLVIQPAHREPDSGGRQRVLKASQLRVPAPALDGQE